MLIAKVHGETTKMTRMLKNYSVMWQSSARVSLAIKH